MVAFRAVVKKAVRDNWRKNYLAGTSDGPLDLRLNHLDLGAEGRAQHDRYMLLFVVCNPPLNIYIEDDHVGSGAEGGG